MLVTILTPRLWKGLVKCVFPCIRHMKCFYSCYISEVCCKRTHGHIQNEYFLKNTYQFNSELKLYLPRVLEEDEEEEEMKKKKKKKRQPNVPLVK